MPLVDDERVAFASHGRQFDFRLRIWRGHGMPAVVLVTREAIGYYPAAVTVRMANMVFGAYLTFSPHGMYYFEGYADGVIRSVNFDVFGHGQRTRLKDPVHTEAPKRELDEIVGEEVEL